MRIKQLFIIIFISFFLCDSALAEGNKFDRGASSAETIVQIRDAQTIQSVIDSCPVAIGSLKEGFSNPYVVNVPPGHFKETYSLVRNAANAASDKRNVEVIFENNPESKFIVNQWESCDEIGDWTGGSSVALSLDTAGQSEGIARFKVERSGGKAVLQVEGNFDFRGYNGFLFDYSVAKGDMGALYVKLFNGTDYTYKNLGFPLELDGPAYYNFSDSLGSISVADLSNITKVVFTASVGSSGNAKFYIDNIRLVRTTPHRTAILRFDDSTSGHWSRGIKRLDEIGFKGNFGIIVGTLGNETRLTLDNCRDMANNGHVLVNHSYDGVSFVGLGLTETYQKYAMGARWMEENGFLRGRKYMFGAGGSSSLFLQDVLDKDGAISAYLEVPSDRMSIGTSFAITSDLQQFVDQDYGGIAQLITHLISSDNEANFVTFLEWIETHFSKVMTFPEVMEKMPKEYQPKEGELSILDSGFKDTLAANFKLKSYFGKSLILDPGGSARNIYPVEIFRPFHRVNLVNTADANEVITFEPTFTAACTHDGSANATALTDSGESWVSGQLVGKLLTNTTDSSNGTITDNNATRITAALANGTDNDFDIGDNCTITPAGCNEAIGQNERGIFVYDGAGGWLKVYVGS
jgi:hypothetical protein